MTQHLESLEAFQWIDPFEILQDITKDLITYNANQSQDNKSCFKLSDLKTFYLDVYSRHN